MELARKEGVAGLSMRKLGQKLGVEAMSLYNHVANKEAILDGLVDQVVSEIYVPSEEEDWKQAMRERAISAWEVYTRYPWALGLLESRTEPSSQVMDYSNAVLGCLRKGGFSPTDAMLAFSTLDSYIYGFFVTVENSPYSTSEEIENAMETVLTQLPAEEYPHLVELVKEMLASPGYSYEKEFLRGLDLVLDGIELVRKRK